jgi:hypothetical protein
VVIGAAFAFLSNNDGQTVVTISPSDLAQAPAGDTPQPVGEPIGPIITEVFVPSASAFRDDFSDPGSGWAQTNDGVNETAYYHGMYRILVDQPYTIYWATPGQYFEDVIVEVTASKVGGADDNYFGVICRYQDENNFYMFSIMSSGYYGIAKVKDGSLELVDMDGLYYSNAIHLGETENRLRAECILDRLIFYVNDIKVIEVSDSEFDGGDVGLAATAFELHGTDILFDDFIAQEP